MNFPSQTSWSDEVGEVFVKLKEIENPGHARVSQQKKFKFLWQIWSTVQYTWRPSTILNSNIPVRDVGSKYIPRFFVPSAPRS